MSPQGRGCLIVACIGFAVAGYFLYMAVVNSGKTRETAYPETVANYLDATPVVTGMVQQWGQAPDFVCYTMDNKRIRLSDYAGKKRVVLMFWRTWNQIGTVQFYLLQRFYKYHSDDVEIIAISSEEPDKKGLITEITDKQGVTFPLVHDPSETLQNVYWHKYVPFYVFIGLDGKVVEAYTFRYPEADDEIVQQFDLWDAYDDYSEENYKKRERKCGGGCCGH